MALDSILDYLLSYFGQNDVLRTKVNSFARSQVKATLLSAKVCAGDREPRKANIRKKNK